MEGLPFYELNFDDCRGIVCSNSLLVYRPTRIVESLILDIEPLTVQCVGPFSKVRLSLKFENKAITK